MHCGPHVGAHSRNKNDYIRIHPDVSRREYSNIPDLWEVCVRHTPAKGCFFVLLDFIRLKNWMKRTKGRFCVFYSVTWLCFPWHCLQGSRILLRFPVWWRQGSRKPRRPIAVDIMCPLAAAEVGRAAEEPARARALQNCDYLCYNLCSLFGVFFTRKQWGKEPSIFFNHATPSLILVSI